MSHVFNRKEVERICTFNHLDQNETGLEWVQKNKFEYPLKASVNSPVEFDGSKINESTKCPTLAVPSRNKWDFSFVKVEEVEVFLCHWWIWLGLVIRSQQSMSYTFGQTKIGEILLINFSPYKFSWLAGENYASIFAFQVVCSLNSLRRLKWPFSTKEFTLIGQFHCLQLGNWRWFKRNFSRLEDRNLQMESCAFSSSIKLPFELLMNIFSWLSLNRSPGEWIGQISPGKPVKPSQKEMLTVKHSSSLMLGWWIFHTRTIH